MTTTTIPGGYSLLTAAQLSNALSALIEDRISFQAIRIFFACIEMKERRKAFFSSQPKNTVRGRCAHYTTSEIQEFIGAQTKRGIGANLKMLKAQTLLTFSEKSIQFSHNASVEAQELLGACASTRSLRRKIPLPRRLIRLLARCSRPSVVKVLLLYILRGLSIKRGGAFQAKGAIKCSLLARLGAMSLRAVRAARSILLKMGVITPDETWCQKKLNRTGAFFTVNLQWIQDKQHTTKSTKSAPPPLKKCTNISPPIKILKTSKEGRNQELHKSTGSSGLSQRQFSKTAARFSEIKYSDLNNLKKLKQLFEDARQSDLVQNSEAGWLSFVAASVRARRHGGEKNAARIFAGIVRKKLYHHLTIAEEDEAQNMIKQSSEAISEAVQNILADVFGTLVCRNEIEKKKRCISGQLGNGL